MPAILKIDVRETQPADVGKRKFREFSKDAFERVGQWWFQHYLPLHFQPFSGAKYGYQRRQKKYEERKRRLAKTGAVEEGGNADLVYSGDSRRAMTRSARVRGYPSRVSITVTAPRYFTFRPRGGQPHKVAEVTRVTPSERSALVKVYDERLQLRLDAFRQLRTQGFEG